MPRGMRGGNINWPAGMYERAHALLEDPRNIRVRDILVTLADEYPGHVLSRNAFISKFNQKGISTARAKPNGWVPRSRPRTGKAALALPGSQLTSVQERSAYKGRRGRGIVASSITCVWGNGSGPVSIPPTAVPSFEGQAIDDEHKPIAMMQREDNQCAWPMNDSGSLCCGRKTLSPRVSYCAAHGRKSARQ